MKNKDILKFIAGFKKRPGTFTDDELYQIGVVHKDIPRRDRDWKALAELVGTERTGEQYRKFVLNRQYQDGTVVSNPALLSDRNIEEVTDEEITEQMYEMYKERQRLRDERTALNRTLRNEARLESFKDTLQDAVRELKQLPTIKSQSKKITPKSPKNDFVEAILSFSDLHIGVDINNFYNTYNEDVAVARVDKLVKDTIQYCKANKVDRLNVVNLGDLIHGILHVSARVEVEFDIIQQIIKASEILSNALNELQKGAPEIVYRSCTDNHARVIANKNEAIEKENLGRLIDWYLEERLKKTNVKFANDNLDVDLGKFNLENGKTVMFAHGHLDSVATSFQNFVGATGEYVHYILLGHYHSERVQSFQNAKVYVNGSIVGSDQYATSKRLFSKPAQTLLIFDGDNIINHSINLDI